MALQEKTQQPWTEGTLRTYLSYPCSELRRGKRVSALFILLALSSVAGPQTQAETSCHLPCLSLSLVAGRDQARSSIQDSYDSSTSSKLVERDEDASNSPSISPFHHHLRILHHLAFLRLGRHAVPG